TARPPWVRGGPLMRGETLRADCTRVVTIRTVWSTTLRTALSLVAALTLTGCASDWKAYGIDTACREVLYFADQDGDGWGLSTDEGVESCLPPETGAVRNNRDCDDDDATITGRVGALCPA